MRRFPVVERNRWLCVWTGDPSRAHAALIADNVLDFAHLSYVHERTLGGTAAIAGARPKVEVLPGGAAGRSLHFHSCQAIVPESATTSHYKL